MVACLSPGAIGVSAPTLEAAAEAARSGGFPAVELDVRQATERGVEASRAAFGDILTPVFGLPVEFRRDEATFDAGIEALPAQAATAAALGATRCATWIMPMSNELEFDDNYTLHRRRLSQVAAVLSDHGISFGLEFVGPKTIRDGAKFEFVKDMPGMLQLAADCGSNVGLLLDCFHWYTSGGTVEAIHALRPEDVVYVHVNDGRPGRGPDEQIDGERLLPGDGGVIDLPLFLGALRAIGYDGPVAVEPFMRELNDLPNDHARLVAVRSSLRKFGI